MNSSDVWELMREWNHKWYGFWNLTDRDLPYPRATDVVDCAFVPEDKSRLIEYLQRCPIAVLCMTPQTIPCDFCEEFHSRSTFQSDGEWLWPDSLAHYVEYHKVALPDSFVQHIRDRAYIPCAMNTPIDINHLDWPELEIAENN